MSPEVLGHGPVTLEGVPGQVEQAEGARRRLGGRRPRRARKLGLGSVGDVDVGIVLVEPVPMGVPAAIGPAGGARPLELPAQARAGQPPRAIEPGEVAREILGGHAGQRKQAPVLLRRCSASGRIVEELTFPRREQPSLRAGRRRSSRLGPLYSRSVCHRRRAAPRGCAAPASAGKRVEIRQPVAERHLGPPDEVPLREARAVERRGCA